jgi:menaquinone-dependent protoporphyrinogen oxidase
MNAHDPRARILVAYASKSGTTAEVAEVIGETLAGEFIRVELRPMVEVQDLHLYDAAVIGSAIRASKWLPAAVEFVELHQYALRQIPVALFTVCLTMMADTPDNRLLVEEYMRPVLKLVQPVTIGLFAGRMEPARLGLAERLIARTVQPPQGDFRDWDAIRLWAADLQPALLAEITRREG